MSGMELAPAAHAAFPPSKLEQYSRCPGSWLLEQTAGADTEEASEAAREGTLLHGAVAALLSGCVEPPEGLTSEQLEAVDECRAAFAAASEAFPGAVVAVEEPLTLHGADGEELTWGTADAFGASGKGGFLLDWKFGRGDVPRPEDNLQLCAYAAALCQRYGLDTVDVWLVQPRRHIRQRFAFEYAAHGAGVLETVARIIADCRHTPPAYAAGAHCRYCRGRSACPAVAADFSAVCRAGDSSPVEQLPALPVERLARLHEAAQAAALFIDAIEAEFRRRLEAGPAAGYALKRTPGGFKAPPPAAAWELLKDILTPDQMLGCCTCTTGKLKAAYAAAAVECGVYRTKKEAAAACMELLGDVLTPAAERVSIVKEDEA